jgi:hypothetical protein
VACLKLQSRDLAESTEKDCNILTAAGAFRGDSAWLKGTARCSRWTCDGKPSLLVAACVKLNLETQPQS